MTPYEEQYENEAPPRPCVPCRVRAAMAFVELTDQFYLHLDKSEGLSELRRSANDAALKLLASFFEQTPRPECDDE